MALSRAQIFRKISAFSTCLSRNYAVESTVTHNNELIHGLPRCVTAHRVEVDGNSLHYHKTGVGKHMVLLLPGALGSSLTDFPQQLNHFNRELFTLIAWDPPGYGLSRPPRRTWPDCYFSRDAEAAIKLMQNIDVTKFSLVGWSDGGITGLMMAARYPELIRTLVVFGSGSYVSQEESDIWKGDMRNIDNWSARMRQPFVDLYGEPLFRELWEEFCDAFLRYYLERGGEICDKDLHKISCPTLIIHGKKDPMVPQFHPLNLKEKIKDAQLHIMEEGKHNLHLRYYKEFNSLVEHFLLAH